MSNSSNVSSSTTTSLSSINLTVPVPTISPVPTPNPTPAGPPTFCITSLKISDRDRNGMLNEREFANFVNRMAEKIDISEVERFRNHANSMIHNDFEDESRGGEIDIQGIKPGQSLSSSQRDFLNSLCGQVELDVVEVLYPPTLFPTIFYQINNTSDDLDETEEEEDDDGGTTSNSRRAAYPILNLQTIFEVLFFIVFMVVF